MRSRHAIDQGAEAVAVQRVEWHVRNLQSARGQFARQRFGDIPRPVGDDDAGAGLGEAPHDRSADAAAAAGHQRDFTGQVEWPHAHRSDHLGVA